MNPKPEPTLLAIFAHPDDEAFAAGGTLAAMASRGVRVVVVSATRGEAGKITDPTLTIDDLGKQREHELRQACVELGIEPPLFLDYHDSGRLERLRTDDPLATINVDYLEMEAKIIGIIKNLEPQVLLTHDPHGAYNHPDHLTVHKAVTAAFFSAGHLPKPPMRLFYAVVPLETMRTFINAPTGPMTPGMTPEVFGVSDNTIAIQFDAEEFVPQKQAALKAHGSQTGPNSRGAQLPEEWQEKMRERRRYENFALGGVRGPVQHWPLQDFFDGLELA